MNEAQANGEISLENDFVAIAIITYVSAGLNQFPWIFYNVKESLFELSTGKIDRYALMLYMQFLIRELMKGYDFVRKQNHFFRFSI